MKRAWYDAKQGCIMLDARGDGGYIYDIDMKRCRDAAQALDWIHQIDDKNWGREIMVEFLDVLFREIPSELWSGKA